MTFDRSKSKREREFNGMSVDTSRYGGDAIKAFRKLKRMYKETRFFEEMRERAHYIKPSEKRREEKKRRKQTLFRLQKERRSLYGNPTKKR